MKTCNGQYGNQKFNMSGLHVSWYHILRLMDLKFHEDDPQLKTAIENKENRSVIDSKKKRKVKDLKPKLFKKKILQNIIQKQFLSKKKKH